MRTEQEVLAYLYRKRDGALSAATRVVYGAGTVPREVADRPTAAAAGAGG
jgi:hypothetical protein